jgi:hypothetical protein
MSVTTAHTIADAYKLLKLDSSHKEFMEHFYVERTKNLGGALAYEITNQDTPAKVLFSGHRGSGKTSELRHVTNILEIEGFSVVFISAIKDAALADLDYTDILLLLITRSLDLISDKKTMKKLKDMDLESEIIDKLKNLLGQLSGEIDITTTRTQTSGYSIGALLKWFIEIGARHEEEISVRQVIRARADKLTKEIIAAFNRIVSSYEEGMNKKIVIIIDDLEKVTDHQRIYDLLVSHFNVIDKLKCHIVFTLPPSLIHSKDFSDLWYNFGKIHFLPLFNVRNKIDGKPNITQIQLMEKIVRKRVSDAIIPSDVIQLCALYSGGLINDFLKLLLYSCPKAATNGNNEIDTSALNESFRDLVNDYKLSLETEDYPKLVKVHNTKDISIDEEHKKMLYRSVILEYMEPDGKKWYDLHPAVEQVLKENQFLN